MAEKQSEEQSRAVPAITAVWLFQRSKRLLAHYSEEGYAQLLTDLDDFLVGYLRGDRQVFIDHIAAATSLADAESRSDNPRSKEGFGRFPLRLLLALQPVRDQFTARLQGGHTLSFALNRLAGTSAGLTFLVEQTKLSPKTISSATDALRARADAVSVPSDTLQTMLALLEHFLPAVTRVIIELRADFLYVGELPPIELAGNEPAVMELLLRGKPVRHADFQLTAAHIRVALSRVRTKLRQAGVLMRVDKPVPGTYHYRFATLAAMPIRDVR